jgi:pimeloyl-ACP methyl ester carboxylesterase
LGDTEWRDVADAADWAMRHGARSLVLVGYSMGGTIVDQLLARAPEAARVRAVILDAPVLDWRATLDLAARRRSLPGFLTGMAEAVVTARAGVDFSRLDELDRASGLRKPVLLFHGEADRTVPIGPSDALARARPDLVREVRVADADHLESWNLGPARYDADVTRFLASRLS